MSRLGGAPAKPWHARLTEPLAWLWQNAFGVLGLFFGTILKPRPAVAAAGAPGSGNVRAWGATLL